MTREEQIKKDLEFGKWGEEVMIGWIEEYFSNGDKHVSYWWDSDYQYASLSGFKRIKMLKLWDLRFGVYKNGDISPLGSIKFEVKTDKYANTGNLCYEIKDNGKFSGVMTSEADYFIYYMPRFKSENLYIIKTYKLKELLLDEKFKTHYNFSGGDVKKTMSIVIPKESFIEDFKAAGGRVETYNVQIPEKFELEKFDDNVVGVHYEGPMREYEDPFDFGEK
jgi:hypothetical protein